MIRFFQGFQWIAFLAALIFAVVVMPLTGGWSFKAGILIVVVALLLLVPYKASPGLVRENTLFISIVAGVVTVYLAPDETRQI